MSNIKKKLNKKLFFQIGAAFTIIMMLTGLILQYGFGSHPRSVGTALLDDIDITLEPNSIYYYSASFQKEYQYIVYTSNADLEYYVFDFLVAEGENLNLIKDQAIDQGMHESSFSTWFSSETIISLIVITANFTDEIYFSCYMRDYTPDQMKEVKIYNVGEMIFLCSWISPLIWVIVKVLRYKRGPTNKPNEDKKLEKGE